MDLPPHISTKKHNPVFNLRVAELFRDLELSVVWDVGAGDGFYGKLLKFASPTTTRFAVEANSAWRGALNPWYRGIFWSDIRFSAAAIRGDLVVFGDVLEHLEKSDAMRVLDTVLQVSPCVVVGPVGFQAQEHSVSWEVHRCGITKEDFSEYHLEEYDESENMMFALLSRSENSFVKRSKVDRFLTDPVALKWGGERPGIIALAEAFSEYMSEGCSVLLVGTGYTPEQYYNWPELLVRVWGCSVSYLEICEGYAKKWGQEEYPVIAGDVRNIDAVLGGRKFDVVGWIQGPEHISSEEMLETFDKMSSVANRGVICTAPWGNYYDAQGGMYGNPFECHVQKSMGKHSFGPDFDAYDILYSGQINAPDAQILIKRSCR